MSDLADETRFRSFAERYVIERASTFRTGGTDELEDAWNAVARAKTIYNHIREKALRVLPDAANDEVDDAFAAAARGAKITATVNPPKRLKTPRLKPMMPWTVDPSKGRSTP